MIDTWILKENADLDKIQHYETIYTLANGYMGLRGSPGFAFRSGKPGCYIAGMYNKTPFFESELPNIPSFINYTMIMDGEQISRDNIQSMSYFLDMRKGILCIDAVVRGMSGKTTKISEQRFVHMKNKQLGVMRVQITPVNYSGSVYVSNTLDLAGAFTDVKGESIHHLDKEYDDYFAGGVYLETTTSDSKIILGQFLRTVPVEKGVKTFGVLKEDSVSNTFECNVVRNRTFTFDIYSSAFTSQNESKLKDKASRTVNSAVLRGFSRLMKEHEKSWKNEWDNSDVIIEGDSYAQIMTRYNIFQLLSLSPYKEGISIGAKGLHGEGYRGHIFWDTEIYLLPFYTFSNPKAASRLLDYRLERLPAAKRYAKRTGRKGARFPWESADTGDDVTPKEGDTSKQEHIIADVAYAVMKFIETNNDTGKNKELYPLILECAKYYSSRVEKKNKGYVINNAIGPDEFHQGVNNNFYTNYLVKKLLANASGVPGVSKQASEEYAGIARNIYIPYVPSAGFHEQFDGYFKREQMDMKIDGDGNRHLSNYHMSIYNSPEAVIVFGKTQLLKQADAVMLYNLYFDDFEEKLIEKAYEYYEPRTTHGSSLSRAPYSMIAARLGRTDIAYRDFLRSAELDLLDDKNGAGIHAASLGGVWQMLVFGFAGMSVKDGGLRFNPSLPAKWKKMSFSIVFNKSRINVKLEKKKIILTKKDNKKLKINIKDNEHILTNRIIVKLY